MKNNFGVVLYEAKCTNNCVFCGNKKMGNIKNNIKLELAKIDEAIKSGQTISNIEISGHDPGEYAKLPEFVAQVKIRADARQITLITNGKKLADINFLKKLISAGTNHFIIPVYGHNANIHDSVTRSAGSFGRTMRGVRNLHALGQKISFQGLITKENQGYLDDLVIFLSKLPFDGFCRLGVPCYKKNNRKFKKSIPDFTLLKAQLSGALCLCQRMKFDLQLFDMPRCLINFHYENMIVNRIPAKAYENLKGNKFHDFKILSGEAVPEYRIKKKKSDCRKCAYFESCEGFFANYIDQGYFKCQPVAKIKK